ncbi:MAG: hypothetical protein U9N02_00030 [Campylobacterota bacterium]|nr:hypothetical protein [Campylobacterota bacterium]
MELQGLSTDQAPPLSVPIRFFITAPLFGILAGILIFFSNATTLMNRYSVESIVITHILTIGFLGFIMLGSLTQMLPVLAGAKISKVQTISMTSYILLTIGCIFMFLGLILDNNLFSTISFFTLGSGFLLILTAIALGIKTVKNFTPTIKGMRVSLIFAISIVFMGLFLLYGYISKDMTSLHLLIADIHSVWAIFGFAGILIISVAFQVLPMFYVAPKFKSFCKQNVVNIIATGLTLWLLLNIFLPEYAFIAKIWIALFFLAFATTVWIKLNKRRRPISDVTVWYWRIASVFLMLGVSLWITDEYFKHEYIVMVAILIGGGFILSIMIGMLYKIIPFLVWFHLNAMGYMSIPTMVEMIDKKLARLQFMLFFISLIGFIFSFYYHELLKVSALSFIFSMIILQYNILKPIQLYIKTKKTKPDFDMSLFN